MTTLTVTTKGQVTLKRDVLRHLNVQAGGKITVQKLPDGRVALEAARPSGSISDVFGMLKQPGRPALSLDDIAAVAAAGWAGDR
jgi:bifunctional DNA-binding transcriptional regulator/antitoxin component of YhaV-PrlF toxin-antitoxin module